MAESMTDGRIPEPAPEPEDPNQAKKQAETIKLALSNPATIEDARSIMGIPKLVAQLEVKINSGKLTSAEKSKTQKTISLLKELYTERYAKIETALGLNTLTAAK